MGVVTLLDAEEEHFAGMYALPESLVESRRAPIAYSVCKYMVSIDHPLSCDDMLSDAERPVGHNRP